MFKYAFLVNNFLCVPITKYCLKASFWQPYGGNLGSHLWFLFESPWSTVSLELDLERQKRKKNLERNKLIENLIFTISLSWIIVLRKKISSEHCIRRIICTQMVILICKMSVILSEIPVSVSPHYNPNVFFYLSFKFQKLPSATWKNSPEV